MQRVKHAIRSGACRGRRALPWPCRRRGCRFNEGRECRGPRTWPLLILPRIQKIPRLLVGASDGYLYMYNLDPQEGGECTLMKQHK